MGRDVSVALLAVVDERARVAGVRFVDAGVLCAVTADVTGAVDVASLDAHGAMVAASSAQDALVKALCAKLSAVIPARFGDVHADDAALVTTVKPRTAELHKALALVRNREQMTLRFAQPNAPNDVVSALMTALREVVVDERVDGTARYHLIERGRSEQYRTLLARFVDEHRDIKLSVTGPLPCYAFAPGALR